MSVKDLKTRTKVLLASAGILGLAGVGLGAANAATPAPVTTQSVTAEEPASGDVADAPDAAEVPDPADAPEAPGDSGPNDEQTGDFTDPVDAPGGP
ncbi:MULTISPECIES: hypothetical protein [unclassified Arthrobacter]|uniref:hypothetical protein n=1 Tax=unclassified Arthrobacter TaxID=235627 RepID=UPI003394EF5F